MKNIISFILMLIIALFVVITPLITYNTPLIGVSVECILLLTLTFIPDIKFK